MKRYAPAALLFVIAAPAAAQSASSPLLQLEATTDERRRGLSWSDGRPTLALTALLPVTAGLELGGRVVGTRGARRHAGADLAADAAARYRVSAGAWRLSAGAVYHAFDRDGLDFAEVEGAAAYTLGPLDVALSAAWAPSQRAIGGDNLYLRAGAEAGVPGTPLTVYGHVGRSIGGDGRVAALRLRPGGDYTDYRLGVDRVRGSLTLGVQLTATSLDRARALPFVDRHQGTRLSTQARWSF